MKITLSEHALERIKERGISTDLVHAALLQPDKVALDETTRDRFVAKKVFVKGKMNYLLLVFYEKSFTEIRVITVISTSKIFKYF